LHLKLIAARSNHEVASLRDEIFMEEQTRWATPGASLLKTTLRDSIEMQQVPKSLPTSAVLLEYVVAEPNSGNAPIPAVRLGRRMLVRRDSLLLLA
jgi:hypothetical protein